MGDRCFNEMLLEILLVIISILIQKHQSQIQHIYFHVNYRYNILTTYNKIYIKGLL